MNYEFVVAVGRAFARPEAKTLADRHVLGGRAERAPLLLLYIGLMLLGAKNLGYGRFAPTPQVV